MDYLALTQPVTKAQIYACAQKQQSPKTIFGDSMIFQWVVLVLLGIVTLGSLFISFVYFYSFFFEAQDDVSIIALVAFGIGIVPAVWIFSRVAKYRQRRARAARIQLFADKNNLKYEQRRGDSGYAGMYFSLGDTRWRTDIISTPSSVVPSIEIGSLHYTIEFDMGDFLARHISKGYLQIRLDRKLPHIVLDATSNDTKIFGKKISNLPTRFSKSQKMNLEGDFNTHFSLYAPKGYERDALYIFTPDLMALMIDSVGAFDAEIVDDLLYIYNSQKPFDVADPLVLERLRSIVQIVGGKLARQTDYYADTNVGDRSQNVVMLQGRRLKQPLSIFTVLAALFFIGLVVMGLFWGNG
jgi:hypothetical protein